MQGAVGIGPAAIVSRQEQGFHFGREDELGIGGIFLLQQTLGGGVILVHQGIFGAVREHLAIGQAHGGVGIRIQGLAFLPFQQGAGEMLAGVVVFLFGVVGGGSGARTGTAGTAVQGLIVLHDGGDNAGIETGNRIGGYFFGRLCGELLIRGKGAVGEEVLYVGGDVHGGEILSGNLQVVFLFGAFAVEFQKGHGLFLVQFHHIVTVLVLDAGKDLLQRGGAVLLQFAAVSAHDTGVQAHELNAIGCLGKEGHGTVGGRIGGDVFGDVLNGGAVLGGAVGIGGDPGFQLGFFLLFAADDVQVLEGEFFTLPLLPAIGAAGVLVGILELYRRVGAHGLPHDVLTHGAGIDADAVDGNHFLELGGGLVALGAAGIAHNHGIVVLLDALGGDLQALGGLVGHVVGAVGGGQVVLAGIHAEHGEVAGVTGPHPVVGLSAELAHIGRRGGHEAYVGVGAIDDKVIDVVVVEGGNLSAAAGVGLFGGLAELVALGLGVIGLFHDRGHIFHAYQEGDRKAWAGDFLGVALGPVAVHEIVVFVGGQALDAAVTAVVVGYQQALLGDHLSRAAAAEVHDGVFQGGLVDGIDLFRGQFATGGLEVFSVELLQERQQPHSFIGKGRQREGHCSKNC